MCADRRRRRRDRRRRGRARGGGRVVRGAGRSPGGSWRRGGGGGRLPGCFRGVGVQPGEDEHEDQDQDGADRGGRAAQAAGAVVDGLDDPVLVPGHEGGGHRVGAGVVEGQRARTDWAPGGGGTGGTTGCVGLGEADRRGARDAEGAGREDAPRRCAGLVRAAPSPARGASADLLERVQLAVVVLDGVHVVVRAPGQQRRPRRRPAPPRHR